MDLGSNIIIDDFVFIGRNRSMSIGSWTHIGVGSVMVGGGDLTIGDFFGASGVRIYTGTEDFTGAYLTNPTVPAPFRKPTRSFVTIGRHVFMGANCVVLPGVTIGDGAAFGACTLVTRDCESWTTYVGQPARAVGTRDKNATLAQERALLSTMEQTRSTSLSGKEP